MSTVAPFRERLSGFSLLEPHDLVHLAQVERAREVYMRALLIMEDRISELWDHPSPSYFTEADWDREQNVVLSFFSGEDSLSKNVQENLDRARDIREEALVNQDSRGAAFVQREATRFMRSLLFTYNQVRMLG